MINYQMNTASATGGSLKAVGNRTYVAISHNLLNLGMVLISHKNREWLKQETLTRLQPLPLADLLSRGPNNRSALY